MSVAWKKVSERQQKWNLFNPREKKTKLVIKTTKIYRVQ